MRGHASLSYGETMLGYITLPFRLVLTTPLAFQLTMSQQLTSLVPVLDGSNYGLWSQAIKAYLMSLGLWGYVTGDIEHPDKVTVDTNATQDIQDAQRTAKVLADEAINAYNIKDDMAKGTIVLQVSPSIQQELTSLSDPDTDDIWDHLESRYGSATPTSIYKDFKEALNVRLNPGQHPGAQIDKLVAAFQHLTAVSIIIPPQIQAMILLAALPQKWEMLVSIVTQQHTLQNIQLSRVRDAILAQYESESMRGGKGKQHNANKISAVKRKHGNPQFQQQQGGNQQQGGSQQQQNDRPKCQRGKRGNGKGKQREHNHEAQITHVASVASIPAPTTASITHIGPSGASKRVIKPLPAKERAPGPYPSVDKAIDLAQRLGVKATIETTKTLEQRITDLCKASPLVKDSYIEADLAEDEAVDMSVLPPGKTNDDWTFEEAEPSYEPPASGDEPLDWGSEDEAYVCSPLHSHHVHALTASHHQLLKELGLKDGSFKLCSTPTVSEPLCVHNMDFALCSKCKGKSPRQMGSLWLLDSGASAHFMHDFNVFIEYKPLPVDKRIPVKTASNMIYVEGIGAVLLKHKQGNKLVTTRLFPVLYIPQSSSRLLSMGEFFQHGLSV